MRTLDERMMERILGDFLPEEWTCRVWRDDASNDVRMSVIKGTGPSAPYAQGRVQSLLLEQMAGAHNMAALVEYVVDLGRSLVWRAQLPNGLVVGVAGKPRSRIRRAGAHA